jgi:CO dehydrogenase maturation factor
MEHLSRRTTRDVDVLLLVTDPTQRGLVTAGRMRDMVPGLDIGVGRMALVVNRVRGIEGGGAGEQGSGGAEGLPAPLAGAVAQSGLELIGTVPDDAAMAEFEFTGRPLVELPAETAVYRAVREIAGRIMAKA